jgi:hypothetical protein
MGVYRNDTTAMMRKMLPQPLPLPIVDLGGRNHKGWLETIIKQPFETWDMLPGTDVNRVVNITDMSAIEHASIGTAICTSVLEHVDRPWLVPLQIAYIMRQGGLLYVTAPFNFIYHKHPEDYWRYTPDALRILFNEFFRELWCDWAGTGEQSHYLGERK